MNNAFEIWNELRSIYLKYIDTGLPIKYKKLEEERKALLLEPDALCKLPIMELVPRYRPYATMEQTMEQLSLDISFANFSSRGLFPDLGGVKQQIYKHQFQSIKAALVDRKHIIATTGTGSGKTECFLFPLLYDVFQEKSKKPSATPAVRGLILYPLNALAEDQMRRLRKSLSSEEVIDYLNDNHSGARLTFGRYTGLTPVSGSKNPNNERKLKQEKLSMIKDWEVAKKQAEKENDRDYLFDITNMDDGVNAELWDRWTMQATPPDILITNYSMLNIMLMRKHEEGIFEATRQWLAEDQHNIFHLVIDELHSYRGTSGTEVAYLIRMLLSRLGITPDSPQIQFLCSSASMQKSDRTEKFVTGFFGLPRNQYDEKFTIIEGESIQITQIDSKLDQVTYGSITQSTSAEAINELFVRDEVMSRLQQHMPHAVESDKLAIHLFGSFNETTFRALEGLFIGLSKITGDRGNVVQPVRAHYFFRNLEGLWACSNPDCTDGIAVPPI